MRKNRSLIVTGLLVCLVLTVIQLPNLVLELLLDLGSFLIDEIIELAHLIYEIFEYSLDQVIEHIFHTDLQGTQSIVFYIQLVLAVAISFPLSRIITSICKNSCYGCCLFCGRKKSSLSYCWGQQTLLYKTGIIGIGITAITFYALFLI